MKKTTGYIFPADVIRVIAICGVVLIHTANAVYARLDFFGGISWWVGLTLDSLSRVAIPFFIMLSGFLLLGRGESFVKTLNRAWSRVGLPLLFWTLIYMWWNGGHEGLQHISLNYFLLLFSGKAFHLYFLFIVIGLYLASSFIQKALRGSNSRQQLSLTIFFLFAGVFEVAGQYIFHLCNAENAFTMWIPYVGLFIAGYVWGNKDFSKNKLLLYALYAGGLSVTLLWNFIYFAQLTKGVHLFAPTGCLSQYSDYYLSINVVIMSLSAFLLLLHFRYTWLIRWTFITRVVQSIAKVSFAMYIIHIFIIEFADSKLHLFDKIAPAWVYIGIKFLTVFVVCYLLATLFTRIPLVKRLFGETK